MIQLPEVTDEFAMWLIATMSRSAEIFSDDLPKTEEVAKHLSIQKLLADVNHPAYDVRCFVDSALCIRFREQIKKAMEEQQ
jgi:hypothetical protein